MTKLSRYLLVSYLLGLMSSEFSHAEMMVRSVVIKSDVDVDVPRLTDLLGLKEGDVFRETILEQGLMRLSESGRYQYLKASYDTDESELTLSLQHLPILESVEVHFLKPEDKTKFAFLKEDIEQAAGVSRGDPIYLDSIQEVRERVQSRLRDKGFLSSEVVIALEQRDNERNRILAISLNPGTRSQVNMLRLSGFTRRDIRELMDYLRGQSEIEEFLGNFTFPQELIAEKVSEIKGVEKPIPGETAIELKLPLDWVALSESLNKWGLASRELGFYDFQYKADLRPSDGDHALYIDLNRGTRYNIQIVGSVAFWERDLRNRILDRPLRLNVPFNVTDAELLILKLYQAQGFADVSVKTQTQGDDRDRKVTFQVKEGPRFIVNKVRISGIQSSEEPAMAGAVEEWLDGMRSPLHKIFYDDKTLRSLVPELLKKIRRRGYLQARVLQFRAHKKDNSILVPLEISVQLGPKSILRSVTLEGNTVFKDRELQKIIDLEIGKPVNVEHIAEVNQRLVRKYEEMGFLFAMAENKEENFLQVDSESAEVDLLLRVDPGPQVRVGKVIVEGLRKTKEKVVLRELSHNTLRSGDIWTPDKKENLEEKLLGLGIFANATAEPAAGRVLQKGDGAQNLVEVQEKDLKVSVAERPAGSVEFGPGYRTDLGAIGFVEWNYRNLGGWNRSVLARTQISRKLEHYQFPEQKYSFTYLEPFLVNDPTRFRFGVTYTKEDKTIFSGNNRIKGFNSEEIVFSFGLERQLAKSLRWFHNLYTISRPRIFEIVDADARADEKYRIGTIGTTLIFDNRNNFFNPVRGIYLSSAIEYSSPRLRSSQEAHYLLLRKEFATYFQLYEKSVIALSLGYARLWGLSGSPGVPLNKRLVLGGQSSIRSLREGYLRYDNKGVLDQASYEAKLEYRHPIFFDIGIAYFTDIGMLESYRVGNSGWRNSAGFGFRYETAVGPLALDIAYNLDRQSDEDTLKVQFGIGRF